MIHQIDSFPGREININGQKHLYFGGTSYLGLQTDAAYQQILIDNIRKYGTNYGASRKSNIQLPIFKKAEKYLAKLVGSEACLTLSSGYLAGQFLTQNFSTSEFKRFYAPNAHCALFSQKTRPCATYTDLNIALNKHLSTTKGTTPVVLIDSIDFSGCNYPSFENLQTLPLNEIILVVDDSHGIGIVGEHGGGVFKKLAALNPKEILVCCSLGKGFAIQAGGVFGTNERINSLAETEFFGGASPATPASLATLLQSTAIFQKKREVLVKNMALFLSNLSHQEHFIHMMGHPTYSFSNIGLVSYLESNRVIVTNFKYPSDAGPTMSRLVLGSQHTEADILRLSQLIGTYFL